MLKNKSIYTKKLVSSVFITILLIYFMIKTASPKIIFVPFLICAISMIGKSISLIMEKKKYVNIFDKTFSIGFLLFWFGFLIFADYIAIKDKQWQLVAFSLVFWIVGIYFAKKRLVKPKEKTNNEKSKTKLNIDFRILISALLVIIALLSGIAMLFFGIKDTYKLNKKTKDYITTNGYFNNYDVFNVDEDGITYKLTYIYTVDGKEYSITTDYGTNYIPEPNSSREIKYNPNNPEESILTGTNSKNGLIYFGAFFTFGSLTFILAALSVLGYFDKFKVDIVGAYIGLLFFIIGIGIILVQTGTTMSLVKTIKSFGLWMLIPIMFVVVGIYQFIKSLLHKNKK
mgnify:CR=1 FL=1